MEVDDPVVNTLADNDQNAMRDFRVQQSALQKLKKQRVIRETADEKEQEPLNLEEEQSSKEDEGENSESDKEDISKSNTQEGDNVAPSASSTIPILSPEEKRMARKRKRGEAKEKLKAERRAHQRAKRQLAAAKAKLAREKEDQVLEDAKQQKLVDLLSDCDG